MDNLITYEQLKARRFSEESSQQSRNAISTLNRFLNSVGLEDSSIVGPELAQNFESKKSNFLSTFKAPSTRYSQSYHLKGWYKYFHSLAPDPRQDTEGHTFQSFVLQRATSMGMDPWDICRYVKSRTPYNWLKYGFNPSSRSYGIIDAISVLLDLEPSFLRDAFFYVPDKNSQVFSIPETRYQKKLKKIKGGFKQITKAEWNELEKLQQELELFYEFKTADILDDGVHRSSSEQWSINQNGYSGSIDIFEGCMKAYFGFLVHQKGVSKEDLSLIHLFDRTLVIEYMKFQNKRHGATTVTIHKFLVNIRAVIKYFIEHPDRIYSKLSREDTVNKLDLYYIYITKRIKSLNIQTNSRDPEEQIRPILDLADPLDPIIEAISYMKRNYHYLCKRYPNYTLNIHELARNIVLMDLLIEKPLRAKNLAELELGDTLVKNQDGRYQLNIPADQVKNNKEIRKTLSEELSRWIDIYLENHQEALCKEKTERLFVSRYNSFLSPASISKTCGRICEKYIGIFMRTHAIRHIRATAYLLKHSQDYVYVADLLNDELKTVVKVYSHLENRVLSEKDDNDLKELREKHNKQGKSGR
jgi:integrase